MGDDGVHMDTDAVTALMGALGDAARQLAGDWAGLRDGIAGGDGSIGGDRIGQAIRGAYDPARAVLEQAADRRR